MNLSLWITVWHNRNRLVGSLSSKVIVDHVHAKWVVFWQGFIHTEQDGAE